MKTKVVITGNGARDGVNDPTLSADKTERVTALREMAQVAREGDQLPARTYWVSAVDTSGLSFDGRAQVPITCEPTDAEKDALVQVLRRFPPYAVACLAGASYAVLAERGIAEEELRTGQGAGLDADRLHAGTIRN